jgi:hypothetical protein
MSGVLFERLRSGYRVEQKLQSRQMSAGLRKARPIRLFSKHNIAGVQEG